MVILKRDRKFSIEDASLIEIAGPTSHVYMTLKTGDYPSEAFLGSILALSTNIRVGWNGLPWKTLVNYRRKKF
jgi:hypothetical protein